MPRGRCYLYSQTSRRVLPDAVLSGRLVVVWMLRLSSIRRAPMTDDDPVAHASAKIMSWASLASVAAETFAQIAALRADQRRNLAIAKMQTLRAERHARYARDSIFWEPMLDEKRFPTSTIKEAGLAWAAAQAWFGDPQADLTVGLAENRLQDLRPDVMRLYYLHVNDGIDPIVAMGKVADLMDRPPAYPAETDRMELATPFTAADIVQQSLPLREESVLPVEDMYRDRLVAACRDTERWFRYQLDGSWVSKYLKDRQLDGCLGPTSPWAVGYAPDSWTALSEHLRGKGYSEQELLDAGLSSRAKRGNLVDRFRNRLMVSVRDANGVTVGFIGRAQPGQQDARTPKYLNSPETMLYKKGELVLGLAECRAELMSGAQPVVVEGAFDAMAVTAAGLGQYVGVAPSGTAVTTAQMHAVRTVSDADPIVALDGDRAGQQAMLRAFDSAYHAGFAPRAALMPDGHDPADLVAGGLTDVLAQRLDDARPLADLVVDEQLNGWPRLDTVQDRVNAAHSAAAVIARFPSADAARQVGRVAERLGLDVASVTAAVTDAVSQPDEGMRTVGRRYESVLSR